ncbi:hypothetical protein WA026_005652 [Henosepilachna vigintioctopunctata]|uniref:Uncharacterized protein n=1 Tax=Henosepilachna vigintioctopunctata TaxID=420089 RepID=A0AAW1U2R6_9CUCU
MMGRCRAHAAIKYFNYCENWFSGGTSNLICRVPTSPASHYRSPPQSNVTAAGKGNADSQLEKLNSNAESVQFNLMPGNLLKFVASNVGQKNYL